MKNAIISSLVLAVSVGFANARPVARPSLNPELAGLEAQLKDFKIGEADVLDRADAFQFESIKGMPTAEDLKMMENPQVPPELQATITRLSEVNEKLSEFNEELVKANLRSDDITYDGPVPAAQSLGQEQQ